MKKIFVILLSCLLLLSFSLAYENYNRFNNVWARGWVNISEDLIVNGTGNFTGVVWSNNSLVCTVDNGLCPDTDTYNTTEQMRTAINNSGYYNISINASNVQNAPWLTSYTETDPLWSGNESRVVNLESANVSVNGRVDSINSSKYDNSNAYGFFNITTLPYQSSAGGWTNDTTTTSTDLDVQLTTGSLYIDTGALDVAQDISAYSIDTSVATTSNLTAYEAINIPSSPWSDYFYVGANSMSYYPADGSSGFSVDIDGMYLGGTVTYNDAEICTVDNGLCGTAGYLSGAAGWTNTTTTTSTSLDVNITSRDAAAVPVTVTGVTGQTGNYLEIRNSTGDIQVVITDDYRLGIGTSSPDHAFHFASEGTYMPQGAIQNSQDTAGGGGYINFRRSRGTIASKTSVTNGDKLGSFVWQGWNGTNWKNSAVFNAEVDGAVSGAIVPGRITFTTMSTTGVTAERLTIKSSGFIGMGDTTPDGKLDIQGANTGYPVLIVQGVAGQSADMLQILTSTGTKLFTVDSAGEVNISTISGDGTGKAVCIKADGNLGTCTDAVGASGTCTCT